ncbi:putative leucine--tRNA ligase, mitochondrial [Cichlidogyrus casuarinus]|uniref:leucine--tRNA ligase n=1 Tax=Cichlidogyrus casuarinus TaxID=1844966 RepID=A0ABD2QFJ8_9PLAT
MFPYPSGNLHMGHLRVYTISDVLTRYYYLKGYNVLHPIGWDAFGLPAENAAIDRQCMPENWTRENIKTMKEQLQKDMNLLVNWESEFATCDEDYYRWTQWIFLKLYEHGLAFHNSNILSLYPQSLLTGLKEIEQNQWRDVIKLQRGWIGSPNGSFIDFDLVTEDGTYLYERIPIHTDQEDVIINDQLTHINIDPSNAYASLFAKNIEYGDLNNSRKLVLINISESRPETNYRTHSKLSIGSSAFYRPWPEQLTAFAKHPLTGRRIPLFYRPDLYRRPEDGNHSLPGLPTNTFDWKLSIEHKLEQGKTANKGSGRIQAQKILQDLKRGGFPCNSFRTDWLVSRQRFWGTPIPIIHCPSCGSVPVPEQELPVKLPNLDKPIHRNSRPLIDNDEWKNVKCPKCSGAATRETDTLDTFVDSAWYFLRYIDPDNNEQLCTRAKAKKMMPVDIYIGGIEHATKHLYYARFISHFLNDIGVSPQREPFLQFIPVGLVLGETFNDPATGKYYPSNQVEYSMQDLTYRSKDSGNVLNCSWEKMSKSKLNGVEPKEVVARLGHDLTRLCMLSNTGPHKARKWEEGEVLVGVQNWLEKIHKLIEETNKFAAGTIQSTVLEPENIAQKLEQLSRTHQMVVNKVKPSYEETFILSVVIARLQTLTESLRVCFLFIFNPSLMQKFSAIFHDRATGISSAAKFYEFNAALADLVIMLHPLSPLISCEFWNELQKSWSGMNESGHSRLCYEKLSRRYKILEPITHQKFPIQSLTDQK